MSDEYPPIPSEIPTTKDGWRQRAIGLKLRLSDAESQNQALQEALKEADRNIAAIRKAADDPAFSYEFVGKVTRSVLAGPPTETQRQILARLSLTVEADSE